MAGDGVDPTMRAIAIFTSARVLNSELLRSSGRFAKIKGVQTPPRARERAPQMFASPPVFLVHLRRSY